MADQFDQMMYEHSWEDTMKRVIESIEYAIAIHLSENKTPTVLLITDTSLNQLLDFCQVDKDKINWNDKDTGVVLDFAGGAVSLRAFRTPDVNPGQIIVC